MAPSRLACLALLSSGCWFDLAAVTGGGGGQGGGGTGGQGAAGAGGGGAGGVAGAGGTGGSGPCVPGGACTTGLAFPACDAGTIACLPTGASVCEPTSPACGCESIQNGDSLYLFCGDYYPFHPLRCGDQYHLVTIDDDAENTFVHDQVEASFGDATFIGYAQTPEDLAEPAGGFEWIYPATGTYEAWFPGQPNDNAPDDCTAINHPTASGTPQWVDVDCEQWYPVVCESGGKPINASDWWDTDFAYRLRVEVDSQGLSASDVPILVTLPGSVVDIASFLGEGEDVRVVAPDGTELAHQIDDWSTGADTAWIWVLVPDLDPSFDHLHVYFGNYDTGSTADPDTLWAGHGGVWHFSDDGFDSSANGLDTNQVLTNNELGSAFVSDGLAITTGPAITIPQDPELQVATGEAITVELWFQRDDLVSAGLVLSSETCCQGYRLRSDPGSGTETAFGDGDCCANMENSTFAIDAGVDTQWHHVAWILDRTSSGTQTLYVDGQMAGSAAIPGGAVAFPGLSLGTTFGGPGVPGTLDELRIVRRALTPVEIALRRLGAMGSIVTGVTIEALHEL